MGVGMCHEQPFNFYLKFVSNWKINPGVEFERVCRRGRAGGLNRIMPTKDCVQIIDR